MEQESFYKDQYDRSLDRKNEINASVSTPIGILTALIAGLYYAVTNFDYNDQTPLIILFSVISILSFCLLACSVFHLIRAFSDFQNGYEYAYLNDTDILDQYYEGLLAYYNAQPGATDESSKEIAQKEFSTYILGELIKSTGINQKNNKKKVAERFQCHKYMIFALISLGLLIIPFSIDFGIHKGKDKVQKVKIDSIVPVSILIKRPEDTTMSLSLKTYNHGKTGSKKTSSSSNPNDSGRR